MARGRVQTRLPARTVWKVVIIKIGIRRKNDG
jgi:hypothetical protein